MTDSNQVTDTSGITEGDGHFLHDYPKIMENTPSAITARNALAKYENPEAAMMGGLEAMKAVGRPHINIPGEDADDAAKTKFTDEIAKHTGAVAKVEDFTVERPEGSDETNYNFAAEKAFLEMAVKTKMNQEQMAESLKIHIATMRAIYAKDETAQKAAAEAAVVTLTSDWGGEANFKTNMELNTRCLEAFFDADTAKKIEETGLGNNVGFAKGILALANMAVKEGRTMPASKQTLAKKGGALQYKKMEARAKEQGG